MTTTKDVLARAEQVDDDLLPAGYIEQLLVAADVESFVEALQAAQSAAEADMRSALADSDQTAANAAALRLLAAQACVQHAPQPTVDPSLPAEALDRAEGAVRSGLAGTAMQLTPLDYTVQLNQYRLMPAQLRDRTEPPVFLPADKAAVTTREQLEAAIGAMHDQLNMLKESRSRRGLDVLGLMASVSTMRTSIAQLAERVAAHNTQVEAANEARRNAGATWAPHPQSKAPVPVA